MLGAIIGDIVGSRFQFLDYKSKEFEFFEAHCVPTDDSFMTLAVAKALLVCKDWQNGRALQETTVRVMKEVASAHKDTGWGGTFYKWLFVYPVPSLTTVTATARVCAFRPWVGWRIRKRK